MVILWGRSEVPNPDRVTIVRVYFIQPGNCKVLFAESAYSNLFIFKLSWWKGKLQTIYASLWFEVATPRKIIAISTIIIVIIIISIIIIIIAQIPKLVRRPVERDPQTEFARWRSSRRKRIFSVFAISSIVHFKQEIKTILQSSCYISRI